MTLIEQLRSLGACESGCNGRCERCPDDVARVAADEIVRLTATLEAAASKLRTISDLARADDEIVDEALEIIDAALG